MRVSKFIHSCVLLEKDGARLLFDPGKFSFVEKAVPPQQFQGLNGIVLTHGHPDHMDVEALVEILRGNPEAGVYGNRETVSELADKGVEATFI